MDDESLDTVLGADEPAPEVVGAKGRRRPPTAKAKPVPDPVSGESPGVREPLPLVGASLITAEDFRLTTQPGPVVLTAVSDAIARAGMADHHGADVVVVVAPAGTGRDVEAALLNAFDLRGSA